MHNLLKCVTAMFPEQTVSLSDEGVDVDFGDQFPSITSAQVAQLARFDDAGVTFSFRDDSRHYDSCTILSYVLAIKSQAAASDR